MNGSIYVVASPIGNLDDFSKRAIDTLCMVDIIAAEDTRITKKILTKYNITTPMQSYHENNEINKSNNLIHEVKKGLNIAIISDAGTPCISDPGYRLINKARINKIDVLCIPGPTSVIGALSISGLPTDSFYFHGFLPKKKGRKSKIEFLAQLPSTVIVFESPYRIIKTLIDIKEIMGNRIISICREMTKKYEQNFFGTISDVIKIIKNVNIKGEFVLIIAKDGYRLDGK
jgi:16S rRNA (cytidine1402-2'-O)-methyltransferase